MLRRRATLALGLLKNRALDAEPRLPIALGASIEVRAQVLSARHQLSESIAFLREELARWRGTSIRTRIQKNLHLLTLEGKLAPPLRGISFEKLRGRPILIFFWAHWCGDCKGEAPVLARIAKEYGPKGLVLAAPTQRYGYTARGQEAAPEAETRYIEQVWKQYYGALEGAPVPVNEENFKSYGASTDANPRPGGPQGTGRRFTIRRHGYPELAERRGCSGGPPRALGPARNGRSARACG